MNGDNLGDRMKGYENSYKIVLPKRLPVIIRVDGQAFHTLTRGMAKPFDLNFIDAMVNTAEALYKGIQGAVFAYVQSDEISVLINNYRHLNTNSWFDNELQKMVSSSASIATREFCKYYSGTFDSRVFVMPKEDVINYFIWRQRDMERNSIQMLARSLYSHKELIGKKTSELQEMCFQKGQNWNNIHTFEKRGVGIYKLDNGNICTDFDLPRFSYNAPWYWDSFLMQEDN